MSRSVRNHLTAGVAAITATALVLSPTTPFTPSFEAPAGATSRVDLAASVKPLVLEPPSPRQLETARAAIRRLDPDAALGLPVAAAAPTPQNAASDVITAGYQFIQYWVDYGVNLAQYVLQFIPYGYLIGAQVGIVYYELIRPISDSVVYDLINPIVNDPLNIWTYINGAVAVGQTTVVSLINTGIAEFNYFFGWLIPPLPLAAEAATLKVAEVEEPEATVLDVAERVAEPEVPAITTESSSVAADAVELPATEEVADVEKVEMAETAVVTAGAAPTTASAGTVQAQGEVRTGSQTTGKADATTADPKPADKPSEPKSDVEENETAVDAAPTNDDATTSDDKKDKQTDEKKD